MKTQVRQMLAFLAATLICIAANAQNGNPHIYSGKSPREPRRIMQAQNSTSHSDSSRQQQIRRIRTEQLRKTTRAKNILREQHAKLEQLQTADQPDLAAINRLIDQIAQTRAELMKQQAATRQQSRKLLTNEQRAQYDACPHNCHTPKNCHITPKSICTP